MGKLKRMSSILLAVALVLTAFAVMQEKTQAAEKKVAVYVVSEITNPNRQPAEWQTEFYTYNKTGLLKSIKVATEKRTYTYNSNNRIVKYRYNDYIKYSYKNGKLSKATYPEISGLKITYSFNKSGLLSKEEKRRDGTTAYNKDISYKYDSAGRITSVSYSSDTGSDTIVLKYDKNGNLKSRSDKNAGGYYAWYRYTNTYSNGRLTKRVEKLKWSESATWQKGRTFQIKYKKIMVPKSLVKRVKKQQELILLGNTIDINSQLAAS